MDTEKYILAILPELLRKYDRKKLGVTFDIGVGTFNFYFEVFHNEGFKTFPIEPLPSQYLKDTTKAKNINLIEACILDYEGTVKIYSGIFQGTDCLDVSSVNKDWWGINENSKTTTVAATTLHSIILNHNIDNITYLKIDTEGSEFSIIKQLVDIEKKLLPKIIEFEYGGGALKKTGIGGWDYNYFEKTLNSIKVCHGLGYYSLLLFEATNEYPIEFNLNEMNDYSALFQDNYVYGNIVLFQKKLYSIKGILNKLKPSLLQKLKLKF